MSRFVRFEGANTAAFNAEYIGQVRLRDESFHLSLEKVQPEEWRPWVIYLNVPGLYPKGFPIISFGKDEIEEAKNYFYKVDEFIASTESFRDTLKDSEDVSVRFNNGRCYNIKEIAIIRVVDKAKCPEWAYPNLFTNKVKQFAVTLEFSKMKPVKIISFFKEEMLVFKRNIEVIASFKTKEEAISCLDGVLDMLNEYDKVTIKESEELLPAKTSEELSKSVSETGKTTENADNILIKESLEDLSQVSTEALIEELKRRNIKVFKKKKDLQRIEH